MQRLPEFREIIDYLPNGKPVCYDHHFRFCTICCVDYTFDDSSDSDGDDDDDDDNGYDNYQTGNNNPHDDDQVFVLWGSPARFLPESDDQLNKLTLHNNKKKVSSSQPTYHFCEPCGLTWLVGKEGTSGARSHPSHYTSHHIYCGTSRSLMVWIDGACPGNGSYTANAGIGVYFGPNSNYNISEALPPPTTGYPTSQKAELTAAVRMLRKVRTEVVPARKILCTAAGDSKSEIQDSTHFRLVGVTDSNYLVDCMCEYIPNSWTEDKTAGVLKNKKGKVIVNSDGLMEVLEEVRELSKVGVQVAWYHVRREQNVRADKLAKRSIPKATT